METLQVYKFKFAWPNWIILNLISDLFAYGLPAIILPPLCRNPIKPSSNKHTHTACKTILEKNSIKWVTAATRRAFDGINFQICERMSELCEAGGGSKATFGIRQGMLTLVKWTHNLSKLSTNIAYWCWSLVHICTYICTYIICKYTHTRSARIRYDDDVYSLHINLSVSVNTVLGHVSRSRANWIQLVSN